MSVINQVLNELEKRGASSPLGEAAIRVVPPRKQSPMRYVFFALALSILLLAVAYWARSEKPLPEGVAMPAPSGAASAPVAAVTMASASDVPGALQMDATLHRRPLLKVPSEKAPAEVPEVKKAARSNPKHASDRGTEAGDGRLPESPANLQFKTISPQQRAENEFQKANLAVQQGRTNDALAGYESALLIDSSHKNARRAWVGVLLSLKRNDEAERVLQRGLKRDPHDISFSMLLARLQVERGDVPLALETLQKTLPDADGQADYHSFVAALMQRQGRHEEALAHYRIALKLVPGNAIWLMGMGISLQAMQRNEEARAAYQRALASNSLSVQLQAFVQQKLKEL